MPDRAQRKLLLVGWDGADPALVNALVERGELPAVGALIERGVQGQLATLAPTLSSLLWTSIATGKRADAHGILSDREINRETGAIGPVSRASCRAVPLWSILQRAGLATITVNWPVSHPAACDAGIVVSDAYWTAIPAPHEDWPLAAGSVFPERLRETLHDLRLHPSELTASDLLSFIPRLRDLEGRRDTRVSALLAVLAEAASIQAATTWLLEHERWDFAAVCFPGLERLGHGFARYCPPLAPEISSDEAALFGEVLAAGYRFHSLMLARLIELAGNDAAVMLVSDHGIRLGHRRPSVQAAATAWHHGHGILCAAGPGIRQDELIHGAGVLDIAPTVLTWFGVPTGDDMDGRALAAMWQTAPASTTIATWETAAPAAAEDVETPPALAEYDEAFAELRDLGYDDRSAGAFERVERTLTYSTRGNLAIVHLHAGRFSEAAAVLRELIDAEAANDVARLYLSYCELRLGRLAESRAVAAGIPDAAGLARERALLSAMTNIADRRAQAAIDDLRMASDTNDADPFVWCLIGAAALRLRDDEGAEAAYRHALVLDEKHCPAHFGLALVATRKHDWTEVRDRARRVVSLDHHRPAAHYLLGVALFHLHQVEDAHRAFSIALDMAPAWPLPASWIRHLRNDSVRPPLAPLPIRLPV